MHYVGDVLAPTRSGAIHQKRFKKKKSCGGVTGPGTARGAEEMLGREPRSGGENERKKHSLGMTKRKTLGGNSRTRAIEMMWAVSIGASTPYCEERKGNGREEKKNTIEPLDGPGGTEDRKKKGRMKEKKKC